MNRSHLGHGVANKLDSKIEEQRKGLAVVSATGVAALAAALEGHIFREIPIVYRVILGVSGILVIFPGSVPTVIGLVAIIAVGGVELLWHQSHLARK